MKRYLFITCLVFLGIIGISAKKEQTPIHRLILQGDSCMNEHDFVATTRSVSPAWIAFLTTVSTMKTCA